MKRFHCLVSTALLLFSAGAGAQDRAFEAKALARYDVSYGRCEAIYPEMKGHRDDAYLSLWRSQPSDKSTARLAAARGSAAYKTERQRAAQAAAKAGAEANKTLERQCRGLWGERARMPKLGQ